MSEFDSSSAVAADSLPVAASVALPPPTDIIAFDIPRDLEGDLLNVQLEDGRVFSVDIPAAGLAPGDSVQAHVHLDEQGNTTLLFVHLDQSQTEKQQQEEEREKEHKQRFSRATKAAAIGAVIGTLILGPIIGAVVAGATYIGVNKFPDAFTNATHSVAQSAIGIKAIAVKDSAVGHIREIDHKLGVSDGISATSSKVIGKARELDHNYNISGRATAASHVVTENLTVASHVVTGHVNDINEKYKVQEQMTSAATALGASLSSASDIMGEKITAAGCAVSKQAHEINDRYKVSETVNSTAASVISGATSVINSAKNATSSSTADLHED